MIGGFIVSGAEPKRVLVRALGPSLAAAGVAGFLPDPTLRLIDCHRPDDCEQQQLERDAAKLRSKPPASRPRTTAESAIALLLAPGSYTAVVGGNGGTTGVGLVEVYDLARDLPFEAGQRQHARLGGRER